MKRLFLLTVVSVLLATSGFAQTPGTASNTDQATVKGCLGGSDGNYTVAEDGTRLILKITSSTIDLKAHLGHEVTLIGQKASGATSSGAADNSFAVTELNMISEHCVAAAAAPIATVSTPAADATVPAATVSPSSATVSTPAVDATPPAATVSPASAMVTTPAVDATPPAATVSPAPATVSTPAADATVPAATVSPSSATVSTPAVDVTPPAATVSPAPATVSTPAAHPARLSVHPRKLPATQAAAATVPAATVSPAPETVIPSATETATPPATASPSSQTVPPAAAATTPTATHSGGSLYLLIAVGVVVLILAATVPFLLRWRKRKMLEHTDAPNLSFSNESSSDQDKPEPRKVA